MAGTPIVARWRWLFAGLVIATTSVVGVPVDLYTAVTTLEEICTCSLEESFPDLASLASGASLPDSGVYLSGSFKGPSYGSFAGPTLGSLYSAKGGPSLYSAKGGVLASGLYYGTKGGPSLYSSKGGYGPSLYSSKGSYTFSNGLYYGVNTGLYGVKGGPSLYSSKGGYGPSLYSAKGSKGYGYYPYTGLNGLYGVKGGPSLYSSKGGYGPSLYSSKGNYGIASGAFLGFAHYYPQIKASKGYNYGPSFNTAPSLKSTNFLFNPYAVNPLCNPSVNPYLNPYAVNPYAVNLKSSKGSSKGYGVYGYHPPLVPPANCGTPAPTLPIQQVPFVWWVPKSRRGRRGLTADIPKEPEMIIQKPRRPRILTTRRVLQEEDEEEFDEGPPIHHNTALLCQTPTGKFYNVAAANAAWIERRVLMGDLISGETILDIPLGTPIDPSTQSILIKTPPALINKETTDNTGNGGIRRQLKSGTKTVLVVRAILDDSATSASEEQLSDSVFGTGGDEVNLKSQYSACSHGKLEFVPASDRNGTDASIENGVVSLTLTSHTTSEGWIAISNAITGGLLSQFGVAYTYDLADHLMYCLPPGTMAEEDTGRAIINGWFSVYNDNWCTSVSLQMHEIGHNLDLPHSMEATNEYGDQTGVMGYSYSNSDTKMCFNGAKNWQLGWYSDKAISFLPGENGINEWSGTIGNIVDYPSDYPVVIRVEQPEMSAQWYVSFNAAKGFNSQTLEGRNMVNVHAAIPQQWSWTDSEGRMIAGESYSITPWNDSDFDTLTITVHSIDGDNTADITIALTSVEPSSAPSLSPTDTFEPSQEPSAVPSFKPSIMPSDFPTVSPAPSSVPSDGPTKLPSTSPSGAPSSSPSDGPTNAISSSPSESHTPSIMPSDIPTVSNAPSSSPSEEPTKAPSSSPSESHTPSIHTSDFPTVSPAPSSSPSEEPTAAPSTSPSESHTPSIMPSDFPTVSPVPSSSPSEEPTAAPSTSPSSKPTPMHSVVPTLTTEPSIGPTPEPSAIPTAVPSASPSTGPTPVDSGHPTLEASAIPTVEPSLTPSDTPTLVHSAVPTGDPTKEDSERPTVEESAVPTKDPSPVPSPLPTDGPTAEWSAMPSHYVSGVVIAAAAPEPSFEPTPEPTSDPTFEPSPDPTPEPTGLPTETLPAPTGEPTETSSSGPSDTSTSPPSPEPILILETEPTASPSTKAIAMPSTSLPFPQPTGSPTELVKETSALPVPTGSPTTVEPTAPVSYESLQLEVVMPVEISAPGNFNAKMGLVCKGIEEYTSERNKAHYGSDTVTTLSCGAGGGTAVSRSASTEGQQVIAVARILFPRASTAPEQKEYERFFFNALTSKDTPAALSGLFRDSEIALGLSSDKINVRIWLRPGELPILKVSFEGQAESPEVPRESPQQANPSVASTLSTLAWMLIVPIAVFVMAN